MIGLEAVSFDDGSTADADLSRTLDALDFPDDNRTDGADVGSNPAGPKMLLGRWCGPSSTTLGAATVAVEETPRAARAGAAYSLLNTAVAAMVYSAISLTSASGALMGALGVSILSTIYVVLSPSSHSTSHHTPKNSGLVVQ